MYWIPSAFLFAVALFSNDLRILAFSALFAFIDTLGDFRRTTETHRIVHLFEPANKENDLPKNPAGKNSNPNNGSEK